MKGDQNIEFHKNNSNIIFNSNKINPDDNKNNSPTNKNSQKENEEHEEILSDEMLDGKKLVSTNDSCVNEKIILKKNELFNCKKNYLINNNYKTTIWKENDGKIQELSIESISPIDDEDYDPNDYTSKNRNKNKKLSKKKNNPINKKIRKKNKNFRENLILNNENKLLYDITSDLLKFELDENNKKEILENLLKKYEEEEEENGIINKEDKSLVEMNNNNQANNMWNNMFEDKHFINSDIRYLNLDYITQNLGFFDVIMIDPPWRIKGAQKIDSSFMFSNNHFSLGYNTMSNEEIKNVKIEKLSKKGYIFLWILANQIQSAGEILNKWGYDLVDIIVWVKLKNGLIYKSQGYYFMHSYELCLVGYKSPINDKKDYQKLLNNNIIFAEVQKKSQKPEEIYELIETILPNSKKLEIFARNHNLKKDWFSIGNQLGEQFEKFSNIIYCDSCRKNIVLGLKRFKSKKIKNFDICEICLNNNYYNEKDFFILENKVNEDILHEFYECDLCNQNPIWGIRFSCEGCQNDYCEFCYDKIIENPNLHNLDHDFKAHEVAILGSGFQIHLENKCLNCYQNPIIGVLFYCTICPKLTLCQICFFKKEIINFKNFKKHDKEHQFLLKFEAKKLSNKYDCFNCKKLALYKCLQCYNFYLCEDCYNIRIELKIKYATDHKNSHYKYEKII